MENLYWVKTGRRGRYGTFANGLELKFRGGCDALGPMVPCILTFFFVLQKHKKIHTITFVLSI